MSASEWVYLDVQVIRRETELAFNVILDDGRIFWIPKSQVLNSEDFKAGDRNLTLPTTDWLADQKGLA